MAHKDLNSELNKLLVEACQALGHLDADRLESMARYCEELIDEANPAVFLRADEWGVDREMAVFENLLGATRANLRVMRRSLLMKNEQIRYGPGLARCDRYAEGEDGVY